MLSKSLTDIKSFGNIRLFGSTTKRLGAELSSEKSASMVVRSSESTFALFGVPISLL